MPGPKTKMNWTKSLGQYTCTIEGKLHRLGVEKTIAEKQFAFVMNKADLAEPIKGNPTFAEIADDWLEYVQQTFEKRRYDICQPRINEFITFVGGGLKVKELRARHVEDWIKSKTNVTKDGTKRLYKSIILAGTKLGRVASESLDCFQSASRQAGIA